MLKLKDTGAIEPYSGRYLIDLSGRLYDDLYNRKIVLPYTRLIVNNFTDPTAIVRNGVLWGWSLLPDDLVYIGNMPLPTSIAIVDYVAKLLDVESPCVPYPRGLTCYR